MIFDNKKGMYGSAKLFGLIIGLVGGAVLVFLIAKGILPLFSICG
ncbi:MAG: hypothetical protein ACOCZV_02420 [Nanoarchaeota archaeon]